MKLVLAEKPSVAQSIAKVLDANKREDGYVLNACSMLALQFLFIVVSFRMDITTAAFYTFF